MAGRRCERCGIEISGHGNRRFCSVECRQATSKQRLGACSIDGCNKPVHGGDLCTMHYARKKKGLPMTGEIPFRTGPYRNRRASLSYEARLALRAQPAPLCRCGCGTPTGFSPRRNRYHRYAKGHSGLVNGKTPLYRDPAWLRREYVEGSRTSVDIAAEFGVVPGVILRSLRRAGIEVRTQSESLRLSGKSAGEENPAWKGGTTPERQRLYKSAEWRELVKSVHERDGFRCQRCGDTRNNKVNRFHAHHVETWADAPERRTDPDNLLTVCKSCHLWIHSLANVDREFLAPSDGSPTL